MKLPYHQLVCGLDRLFFSPKPNLQGEDQTQERADTIEAYLTASGWTWDQFLDCMYEETPSIPTNLCN